jgi:ribosome maturation factor RimP
VPKDLQLLEEVISKALGEIAVDLVDLELRQGTLTVTVSRFDGLDLDSLTQASRLVSDLLDADEALAPEGHYELEVSSPGLERRLRRPEHFRQAIGESISVRTRAGVVGDRRFEGTLVGASETAIVVERDGTEREVAYDQIDRAHLVFDWRAALAADSRDRGATGGAVDAQDPDDAELVDEISASASEDFAADEIVAEEADGHEIDAAGSTSREIRR